VSDKLGRTALHSAALVGNKEAVQSLLEAGAQVDSRLQISSWPKQQLDSHSSLDSNYTVDVECKDLISGFKVSRGSDNIPKVIFHCI
jgi:ankyrin repeat protein